MLSILSSTSPMGTILVYENFSKMKVSIKMQFCDVFDMKTKTAT